MARVQHHRVHANDRQQRSRVRLAQEAARLMAEHGIRDFQHAKSKAAQRLGIVDTQALPRNQDIEQALRERQRLFHAGQQPLHLQVRREAAMEAMRFLAAYQPRLVGGVLEGTADAHSSVILQVFHDQPEQVDLFLQEHGIPTLWQDRRLRTLDDRLVDCPVIRFAADDIPFELIVLPVVALRQPLLPGHDGRPAARASLTQVEMLLAESEADTAPRQP
ncbi:hypothetical protein ACYJW8_15100 [Frateuria aurantia]